MRDRWWVAGNGNELMLVSDHEAEIARLRAIENAAQAACEAEFTSERLAAMDRLRSALSVRRGEEAM